MSDRTGDELPIAELSDETAPRSTGARPRRRAGIVALACVVIAAVPIAWAVAASNDGHSSRKAKTGTPKNPRVLVLGALDASIASGNFNFVASMQQTPGTATTTTVTTPCSDALVVPVGGAATGKSSAYCDGTSGVGGAGGMALQSHGTINLNPLEMVATSDISPYGQITSWVNATTVWERGGGYYGMTGPNGTDGAPLPGFANLVISTLGPREGPVAMMSLSSPGGYLNLARAAITDASRLGPGTTREGVAVTEYQVTVNAAEQANRPDMSPEQREASATALAQLKTEGYTSTTVKLGIDTDGLIRESATSVKFDDGGSVDAITTFSNFGCADPIVFPGDHGPPQTLPASCNAPHDASGTTTADPTTTDQSATATSDSSPTSTAATPLHVEGTFKGTEQFTANDSTCPQLDHHLDAEFTLAEGAKWNFHSDYCGTVNGNQWQGGGGFLFTTADGSTLNGKFHSEATLPSPGVPYMLNITNGTGQFAEAKGSCDLDNHLKPIAPGVQEQSGSFTCDITS